MISRIQPDRSRPLSAIAMPVPDPAILARRDEIVAGLTAILGERHVISAEDERRAYESDALNAYRAVPLAVVLPGSTEEVAAVLRYLGKEGIKVIPRGAGTSLSGGALPTEDAVVVGLARLNRILAIDYDKRWRTAASSTRPTRRASSPAPSPATSP
jgi:glycolate oxidase